MAGRSGRSGGSRRGWDKGIFPKQHQSRSWREGLVRQEGRKEGAEANGSEEGVDLGREGQESPIFPLLLFPGRAERLGHQGPQAPSPDGWPQCVLTADGGARGGTCGKRGGHSRVRRGWQGWGQEIRGARAPHHAGTGSDSPLYSHPCLRRKGCSEPIESQSCDLPHQGTC